MSARPTYTYPRRKCDWCARTIDARRFMDDSARCSRCEKAIALAAEHDIALKRGEGAFRCCRCETVKRFSSRSDRSSFSPTTSRRGSYSVRCKPCETQRVAEHTKAHPENKRARQARYRARIYSDPSAYQLMRERGRASARRRYQRIRQDPKRWAEALANNRIYYRLKAEREGREITRVVRLGVIAPWKSAQGNNGEDLPEAPLRAWLNAIILSKGIDVDISALAADLGIDERQLHSIRRAEYASRQLGVADRMLTRFDTPIHVPGYGTVWRVEDLWPAELGYFDEELAA